MMYSLAKKIFFQCDAEKVHDYVLDKFSKNSWWLREVTPRFQSTQSMNIKTHNLKWRNPIGLAAGFDKNGVALDFLDYLGFGAIEVGTVTLKPQVGNPKPRIWRYPNEKALRNALGFPCQGAKQVYQNIKDYRGGASLGINIGKNKETTLEEAPAEYAKLFSYFENVADYLVINISSPNTQGLRELQSRSYLEGLLSEVLKVKTKKSPPLFVKVSPDENLKDLENILDVCLSVGVNGLIATNTTTDHPYDRGGYSGAPLFEKSKKTWEYLLKETKTYQEFDIVGVGGFSKKEDLESFKSLGGSCIQIYTGFIFDGPKIFKNLLT